MIIGTILRRSDPEPLEIAAGLMALAWGTVLAIFGSWSTTFDQVHPAHLWSKALWGNEWHMGVAFAVVGALQLSGVEMQLGPRARGTFSAIATGMWSAVAISFVHGATIAGVGTGVVVYCMFTLCTLWIVYRHAVELRVRGEMRRAP